MKYQNFNYEVEDNEITITGYRGRKAVDLVIPSAIPTEMGDLPVIEIGSASFFAKQITGVTIPDTVKFIGDSAFVGCNNLTKVTIGNDVTSIGDFAFFDCGSLTSATIPNSVTSIGDWAFRNCVSLTSVVIGSDVRYIGNEVFAGCSNLTSVTIPDSVTDIGDRVFEWCCNLVSINVSENNKCYSSQDGVLFNKNKTELICCPGGKTGEYTVPNGVITLCKHSFNSCINLALVAIPDSIMNISEDTFSTGIDGLDELNKNLQIRMII